MGAFGKSRFSKGAAIRRSLGTTGLSVLQRHFIKLYRWKYHIVIGRGIDEKSPCKWKRDCRKYCRVSGSGIDEKSPCESWSGIDEKHRASESGIAENHLESWSGIDEKILCKSKRDWWKSSHQLKRDLWRGIPLLTWRLAYASAINSLSGRPASYMYQRPEHCLVTPLQLALCCLNIVSCNFREQ